jgi:hypothetical protein
MVPSLLRPPPGRRRRHPVILSAARYIDIKALDIEDLRAATWRARAATWRAAAWAGAAKLVRVHAQLVTAVALYGTKTGAFRSVLETVQAIVGQQLGGGFRPYTLDQIHGTVIRLDGARDTENGLIVNQRYFEYSGTPRAMDHARASEILAACLTPPLSIRVGGFSPDTPVMFSSRGQHPYERTFSVQGDAFVLMGWPVSTVLNGISSRPLDDLRRKMNDANIMHWYHESSTDIDNDLHLVIGHHNWPSEHDVREAVHCARAYLAQHPVQIEVGVDQIVVIAANSPTLAPAQFIGRLPLNPVDIAGLYR